MTLKEIVATLPELVQVELAIHFLEIGLPIWDNFVQKPTTDLTYYSFMVGMKTVDSEIIKTSIELAKQWINPQSSDRQEQLNFTLEKLIANFNDHLLGMRDWELEMDRHPQLVFYAASNLLNYIHGEKITIHKESSVYVAISQTIDAILRVNLRSQNEIDAILKTYLD